MEINIKFSGNNICFLLEIAGEHIALKTLAVHCGPPAISTVGDRGKRTMIRTALAAYQDSVSSKTVTQ